jgi:glycerol-3-phosphate dehydrogenase (NAD(P)+)
MRAAVLGAGSWGTTFAQVLCDAGTPTTVWARHPDVAAAITEIHENPRYFPGLTLPPTLTATTDVGAVLDGADLVVLSVPAQTLRENLTAWAPHIPDGSLVVSLMKGIELGSRKRMSEVIREVLDIPESRVALV